MRICTPPGRVLLPDEFDQLEASREGPTQEAQPMNSRPLRTAYELRDIIVEQARALLGSWPSGMTLFIFNDAYGWNASISRPTSEAGNFYRTRTLDLIEALRKTYDLNILRMSDDLSDVKFCSPSLDARPPKTSTWQKPSKEAIGKSRNPKKRRSK